MNEKKFGVSNIGNVDPLDEEIRANIIEDYRKIYLETLNEDEHTILLNG